MLKKLTLSIFIITMFLSNSAFAETPGFFPIQFVKDTLKNGLNVIYTIDKSAPVVATVVHYEIGSRYERPGKTGYTHFFEHLMFEATNNYKRAEIDKFVEEAGGTLNAHTATDETVYYLKLPSNYLEMALWIEASRMRGLHVDSVGVNTQKGVVSEELKMRVSNSPYGTMLEKIFKFMYEGTPYEWTTIGSLEEIQTATIDDFKGFYDGFYYPNNATLVISGDFEIAQARALVDKYFAPLPRKERPAVLPVDLLPIKEGKTEEIEDEKAQATGIFIGYRGINKSDPNSYALDLLSMILTAGQSSRIYQRLVDKDQISVQSGFFPYSMEKAGALIFYSIVKPGIEEGTEKNIKTIDEEIQKIIKNGVTEAELQKAKNITESSFVGDKMDALSRAESLASYNAYFGDPNLINTEIKKYMAVTAADIQRVAKMLLDTDKRIVLIYNPKKSS